MLIRGLEIEGLNCFGTRFRLDGLSDSVNVLYGPNGIGKSTLSEGIAMAFLRPHRSMAESVVRCKPWNRALHPATRVEFEHSGHLYRVSKRFIHKPEAKLERREGGTWNLFAQGDGAEGFLQKVLRSAAGRATTAQDLSGFAQVLWTTQGQLQLPPLGESVVTAVRASIRSQLSASSKGFEQRIADAFAAVFTPTGRLREGQHACEKLRLQAEVTAVQDDVNSWRSVVDSYEAVIADINKLESKAAEESYSVASIAEQLTGLQERSKRYVEVSSKVRELLAKQDTAMAHWIAANNAIQLVQQTHTKVSTLLLEIKQLEEERKYVLLRVQQVSESHAAAKGLLVEAEKRYSSAQSLCRCASFASEYLNALRRKEEIEHKLSEVAKAGARIQTAQGEAKRLRIPSQARTDEFRRTVSELTSLQQKLELARVKVSFTPAHDCDVILGESLVKVVSGQSLSLAGDPNLGFSIVGVGHFDVTGPVGDFTATLETVGRHKNWVNAFAEEFGTASVDEITARCDRHRELQSTIREDNSIISNVLARVTEGALAREALLLQSRLTEIEQLHPAWASDRPDVAAMSGPAEAEFAAAKEALDREKKSEREQNDACQAEILELTKLKGKIETTSKLLTDATQALNEVEQDGKTDPKRQEELNFASAELIMVRRECDAAQRELTEIGPDPAPAAADLQSHNKHAVQRQNDTLRRLNELRGKLGQLCTENPQAHLNRAEETVQELSDRLAAVTLKTEALALLKKSVDATRAEMLSSVSQPVESAASTYLEKICGRPFASIRLTADFASQGVVPNDHLERGCVAEDRMSSGEREQIHLCTRLALATELARAGKQVVILDDVLTATDSHRMHRINEIISDCAGRLQILIFTCHPERFHSMQGAKFFDLQALFALAQREVA